jgi:protein arginine N-methyltransferase 1
MERLVARTLLPTLKALRSIKQLKPIERILYQLDNAEEFSDVRSHEVMLADKRRIDLYKYMIDKHVRPEHTVADLGTGSGILAFLAARRGARLVHAIEATRMIDLAAHVAHHNDIRNIAFHNVHSRDFNPPEKVDIILHEQIGDFLIDEDMIANVCDLRDRVLAPGGRILPAKFEAYLEPLSVREHRDIPLIWEQSIHGVDFGCTRAWLADRPEIAVQSLRHVTRDDAAAFLTEPFPAYAIDLETVDRAYVPGAVTMKKTIVRDGVMEGFCQYFRIYFDETNYFENSPFTTDPTASNYHWGTGLYPTGRVPVREGDVLTVEWPVNDATKPSNWRPTWAIEGRA